MKRLFIFLFFIPLSVVAQNKFSLQGIVVDEAQQPLPAAHVSILSKKDSTIIVGNLTKADGSFLFTNIKSNQYLLKISYIGFQDKYLIISLLENINFEKIVLSTEGKELDEVVVKADKQPMALKKDTLEFDAGVLKPQANDNLEDLVKKLPTIEIDENGAIKTQNKVVRKVLVDGKEFFGNDPNLALKNLPAEAIDKIQVVEKKTDQAEFSGVDDGEREIVINVTLKKTHKKGNVGFGSVGYFPQFSLQNQAAYSLKGSLNRFSSENQISFIGFLNNLNQQGFTPQDINNFTNLNGTSTKQTNVSPTLNVPIAAGKKSGLLTPQGLGVNYNNQYKKRSSVQSSYFYTATLTELNRNLLRESYVFDKMIATNQDFSQRRNDGNHRVNLTWNHELNERNNLRIITNLNTVKGDFDSKTHNEITTSTPTSKTQNLSDRTVFYESEGINFNTNGLFRHRFSRPRRMISLNGTYSQNNDSSHDSTLTLNTSFTNNQSPVFRQINQLNNRSTQQFSRKLQIAYSEPLTKNLMAEVSYAYQNNLNTANFKVWDLLNNQSKLNQNLSNSFKNTFIFQQIGTKINHETAVHTFVAGVTYQLSNLKSFYTRGTDNFLLKTYSNFLPMMRFTTKKKSNSRLTIEYNTSVNEPSVRDLQPISITNNPQNIFVGNPDLKPQFVHRFNWNQSMFQPKNFQSFWVNGSFNYLKNPIGYSQFISDLLVRTTKPVNLPFRWNTNWGLNYTFSLKKQKKNSLKLSFTPKWTYAKGNSLINGTLNLTKQNQWNGGTILTYLTDDLTLIFNNSIQQNDIQYSENEQFNQQFSLVRSLTDFRWKFRKTTTFTLEFDYTHYRNSRLTVIQRNIPILNLSLKQLFLKGNRGEISLSVQDFCNKNIYLNQRTDENFSEIERATTLGRYFFINFMYSIRKK